MIFITTRAQENIHGNPIAENKINKDMIMLPISGNILLYDFAENIHSQRLKIIYNSAGNNSEEKDDFPSEKSVAAKSIPYVHFIQISFVLMISWIFFLHFFIFFNRFDAAKITFSYKVEKSNLLKKRE